MMKNFYEDKLLEIKDLVNQKNFLKAYQELKIELKMPFIPQPYYESFLMLFNQVEHSLNILKWKSPTINEHTIIDWLLSNEFQKQLLACSMIETINLSRHLKEIKICFDKPQLPNIIFVRVFEELAKQKIQKQFVIKGKLYIPADRKIMNEHPIYLKYQEQLFNYFEKDVSLLHISKVILEKWFSTYYFNLGKFNQKILKSLIMISISMLDHTKDLKPIDQKLKHNILEWL